VGNLTATQAFDTPLLAFQFTGCDAKSRHRSMSTRIGADRPEKLSAVKV
jgi:hypothetical protein